MKEKPPRWRTSINGEPLRNKGLNMYPESLSAALVIGATTLFIMSWDWFPPYSGKNNA